MINILRDNFGLEFFWSSTRRPSVTPDWMVLIWVFHLHPAKDTTQVSLGHRIRDPCDVAVLQRSWA